MAHRPSAAAAAGHPWPAWFQDTVQHAQLLTNKTLRQYLLAHSAEQWPAVAKATLLYGVLCLQRDFPGQPVLPLQQLHEASRRLHAEAAFTAALPTIRSQFESLEADVGGFLSELDPNPTLMQGLATSRTEHAQQQPACSSRPPSSGQLPRSSAAPTHTSRRPSTAGSTATANSAASSTTALSLQPKPKPPAIYPDWWPKDAAAASMAARHSATARQRPQPRLAYSRPPTAPPDPTRDDLPSAALLLVPSRVHSTRAEVGSAAAAQEQQRPQQQGGGRGRRQAESKVALQHAQRLALQRQQQREQQELLDASWGNDGSTGTAASIAGVPMSNGHQASSSRNPTASCSSPRYDPAAVAKWRQHFGLG